jgi:hypothetical protein
MVGHPTEDDSLEGQRRKRNQGKSPTNEISGISRRSAYFVSMSSQAIARKLANAPEAH